MIPQRKVKPYGMLLLSFTKHLPAPAKHNPRQSQGLEAKPADKIETKRIKSGAINSDAVDLLCVAYGAPKNLVSAMTV